MTPIKLSKDKIIIGLVSLFLFFWNVEFLYAKSFKFAVLGDTRSGDPIYNRIIEQVLASKVDFIINTGDFLPEPDRYPDIYHWERFKKMSSVIECPYYLTVGNHDVNSIDSENIYKEQVSLPGNEIYYSFDYENCCFIILDSEMQPGNKSAGGIIETEQMEFLKKELERAEGKEHIFVSLHRPFYPVYDHVGSSLDTSPELRDKLHNFLSGYKNVHIIFEGHDHYYHKSIHNGIVHIITGGGGAPLSTSPDRGGFHHYVLVEVNGMEVKIKALSPDGEDRDSFVLDREFWDNNRFVMSKLPGKFQPAEAIISYKEKIKGNEPVLVLDFNEKEGKPIDTSKYKNSVKAWGRCERISDRFGSCYLFEGENGFITVDDDPSLRFEDAASLEAWVSVKEFTDPGGVIDRCPAYMLRAGSDNLMFYVNINDWQDIEVPIEKNKWYYAVATYDSTNAEMKLYLDGILKANKVLEVQKPALLFMKYAYSFYIGANPGFGRKWYFDGKIDEVKIYPRVLTEQEIKRNYETFLRK